MDKEELLESEYRKYVQPKNEPTLYQKKITDKKGIKYFINCYHYIFPEHSPIKDSWDFKLQTTLKSGTVNITLFNTDLNIKDIEIFMEETWINYGSVYYELKDEVQNKNE